MVGLVCIIDDVDLNVARLGWSSSAGGNAGFLLLAEVS